MAVIPETENGAEERVTANHGFRHVGAEQESGSRDEDVTEPSTAVIRSVCCGTNQV